MNKTFFVALLSALGSAVLVDLREWAEAVKAAKADGAPVPPFAWQYAWPRWLVGVLTGLLAGVGVETLS